MTGIDSYLQDFTISYSKVDQAIAAKVYKPRDPFANKGTYGHALLIAGSFGKMGAALLAARGCLHSGAGLLTAHIPVCGYAILQTAVPEAMVTVDPNERIPTRVDDPLDKYAVIGIGPGIGTDSKTRGLLAAVFEGFKKPMLIDADALNILSASPNLLTKMPPGSILTPPSQRIRPFVRTATRRFYAIFDRSCPSQKMERSDRGEGSFYGCGCARRKHLI